MGSSERKSGDKRLFHHSYFIPFGTFNTDRKVTGRAREILVGRNNQRGSFIRRLLNSGKGGAYLITGQRGTGKTSFVEYCLQAYEENSVQRFLNSKMLRNVLDNIVSAIFILCLLLLPLFLISLLYCTDNNIIKLILGIPILLISLTLFRFPYLYLQDMQYALKISRANKKRKSGRKTPIDAQRSKRRGGWKVWLLWSMVLLCTLVSYLISYSFIIYYVPFVFWLLEIPSYQKHPTTKKVDLIATSFIQGVKAVYSALYATALLATLTICIFFSSENSLLVYNDIFQFSLLNSMTIMSTSVFVALSVLVIFLFEYEYVIKPAQLYLQDRVEAETDDSLEHLKGELAVKTRAAIGNYYRRLLTHSWLRYYIGLWNPVIKIKVNLGFDDIDHPKIIHALLKQLKSKYRKSFLLLNNARVCSIRAFIFVVLFVLTIIIGDGVFAFKPPEPTVSNNQETTLHTNKTVELASVILQNDFYKAFFGIELYSKVDKKTVANCRQGYINYDRASFFLLNFPLIHITNGSLDSSPSFFRSFISLALSKTTFPFAQQIQDITAYDSKSHICTTKDGRSIGAFEVSPDLIESATAYSIRLYHILVFIFLLLCYIALDRFLPLLPYRHNVRQFKRVIDRLTATQTEDHSVGVARLRLFRQASYAPLDSRDIELLFLDLIESLTVDSRSVLGQLFNLPSPDITIIFDELDKLGSSAKAQQIQELQTSHGRISHRHYSFDYARTNKVKELLSDMKNLIDSKHCRFILIGGRHLRDEWLADGTKRDQLLPSIFDKSIYLPSLLGDKLEYEATFQHSMLLKRIKEYVVQQYVRANHIYERSRVGKILPLPFATKQKEPDYLRFVLQHLVNWRVEHFFDSKQNSDVKIFCLDDSSISLLENSDNTTGVLVEQFVKYLAFRSHGIPKRLNEVFFNYIRPLNRVISPHHCHYTCVQDYVIGYCEDVLLFTGIDIFRIQLTAQLYDRINRQIGRKLYGRDDKLISAVFLVTDFIMKFHNRAFDADSLHTIDEITDINRAPDLFILINELIGVFSQMIIRPVANGLYSYRFRSGIAAEIRFLSKLSPPDSAAFNFTLDESQSLKELYIKKLDSQTGATAEIAFELAELFSYDQEYDAALREYHNAVEMIDVRLKGSISLSNGGEAVSILKRLESKWWHQAEVSVSQIADWVVFRLRLILKIAMCYEQTRNFERAKTSYHEAHHFSHHFLRLMFDEKVPFIKSGISTSREKNHYLSKHLPLFYQAGFAKAWLAEKLGSGVDTSTQIVANELFYIEQLFDCFKLNQPVINDVKQLEHDGSFGNARFGMIKAEMYKKAADLCLFKGVNLPDGSTSSKAYGAFSHYGYIYRASYYYAVSLHYVRRYNLYRVEVSCKKYALNIDNQKCFSAEQLPDYLAQAGGSALNGLACTLLARIDFDDMFNSFKNRTKSVKIAGDDENPIPLKLKGGWLSDETLCEYGKTIKSVFRKWFENFDEPGNQGTSFRYGCALDGKDESFVAKANIDKSYLSIWQFEKNDKCFIGPDEFIDLWLGHPKKYDQDSVATDIVETKRFANCAIEQLCVYMALSELNADFHQGVGRGEDAENELLRIVTSVISVIDTLLFMSEYDQKWFGYKVNLQVLVCFLFERGMHYIDRIIEMQLMRRFGKNSHEKQINWTKDVSNELILAFMKLLFVAKKFAILQAGGRNLLIYECKVLFTSKNTVDFIRTALGIDRSFELLSWKDFESGLINRCISHRYPVLGRLEMINVLCRIKGESFNSRLDKALAIEEIAALVKEMIELEEQYDSPFHFRPSQMAFTCFFLAEIIEKFEKAHSSDCLHTAYFYARAIELFEKAQQMNTMRNAYYYAIKDMYYLFDDFNDWQVNHGRALQILTSSLTVKVREQCEKSLSQLLT